MEFLEIFLKSLLILAMILLMALPFILEFFTMRSDKKNKISYKRFRMVVYTGVYILLMTIAMYLLKELFLWLETQSFIQWIVAKVAATAMAAYCSKVFVAILVNFGIGFLFFLLSKLVRVGMKKILAQISLIKYYKLCDNNLKN